MSTTETTGLAATEHRTVDVDGVEIFYREAGDPASPTLFGQSAFPPPREFEYSFANLTTVVERFIDVILTPEANVWQWTHGVRDPEHIDPDLAALDTVGFDRPGNRDMQAFLRELHLLDTGHFALEEEGGFIAGRIREFLGKHAS